MKKFSISLYAYSPICFLIFTLISCSVTSQENNKLVNSEKINLHCELRAESAQTLDKGIWLSFEIQSNLSIKLLPWQTPLEGLMGDLFKITDSSGEELSYQGPMVKRRAPTLDDYISIQPNEKKKSKIDLSLAYSFESKQKYQISLKDTLFNVFDKEQKQHFVPCLINKEIVIQVE